MFYSRQKNDVLPEEFKKTLEKHLEKLYQRYRKVQMENQVRIRIDHRFGKFIVFIFRFLLDIQDFFYCHEKMRSQTFLNVFVRVFLILAKLLQLIRRHQPPLTDPCGHLKMAKTFQRSIRYYQGLSKRDIERIVYPIPHCVYPCRVYNPPDPKGKNIRLDDKTLKQRIRLLKIRYFVINIMLYEPLFILF